MKLQRELKKQLAREFSGIRPDILKVVVGIVTEGMDRQSPDQIFCEIFDEEVVNVPSLEKRDSMIYETLLTCAREICGNSNKINEIKGIIQRAVEKVGIQEARTTSESKRISIGQRCTIFSSNTTKLGPGQKRLNLKST